MGPVRKEEPYCTGRPGPPGWPAWWPSGATALRRAREPPLLAGLVALALPFDPRDQRIAVTPIDDARRIRIRWVLEHDRRFADLRHRKLDRRATAGAREVNNLAVLYSDAQEFERRALSVTEREVRRHHQVRL